MNLCTSFVSSRNIFYLLPFTKIFLLPVRYLLPYYIFVGFCTVDCGTSFCCAKYREKHGMVHGEYSSVGGSGGRGDLYLLYLYRAPSTRRDGRPIWNGHRTGVQLIFASSRRDRTSSQTSIFLLVQNIFSQSAENLLLDNENQTLNSTSFVHLFVQLVSTSSI